ncbi:MAG TPA: VOC family protein [Candidatus Saccharimonadales bacterium]|jgi:PhnB protein
MQTRLNPYLSFQGNAEEVVAFYQEIFGGNLTKSTFAEGGMPHDPAEANWIMHAMLETENGMVLMASDTPTSMEFKPGSNGAISLSGDNEPELRGYYEKLSAGGTATLPLSAAPWGDAFGMCTDKYGINWMVNISGVSDSAQE